MKRTLLALVAVAVVLIVIAKAAGMATGKMPKTLKGVSEAD
jgi:hypothetical protein